MTRQPGLGLRGAGPGAGRGGAERGLARPPRSPRPGRALGEWGSGRLVGVSHERD